MTLRVWSKLVKSSTRPLADISRPSSTTPPQNQSFSPALKYAASGCLWLNMPPACLIQGQSQFRKKLFLTKVANSSTEQAMNSGPTTLWTYLEKMANQEKVSWPIHGINTFLPKVSNRPVKASARKL